MGESYYAEASLSGIRYSMDVKAFNLELFSALSDVDFVEHIEIETEAIVVNGRAFIYGDMFLEIYFNEVTGTMAFALIKVQTRIWGIDKDATREWHEHPIHNPDSHVKIQQQSIRKIIKKLEEVIKELK